MALALGLLIASLAVFLASTRQFPQPERSLIWLIGVGLCAWSAGLVINAPGHYGLLRALIDASSGSALVGVFVRNTGSVAQFVPQLLDLFVVAAVLVGVFAAIAFTPGEKVERFVRPSILTLFGFMAGAIAALALVAVGLGGQVRPRSYLGYVGEAQVHDGDTFQLGEVSLRLWGVDAPEMQQDCRGVEICGERARVRLASLVRDALVQCDQKESMRTRRLVESFGRPLVRCWVRAEGQPAFDLGERMIRYGYAVQYRGDSSYGYGAAEDAGHGHAIMSGCLLRPDIWRTNAEARRAFDQGRALPEGAVLVGDCPTPRAPELEGAGDQSAEQDPLAPPAAPAAGP